MSITGPSSKASTPIFGIRTAAACYEMTQPAWPSTMWQILSSDYDTQASYYGVKEASEPVHVQLNLPDLRTAVVNNTISPLRNLTLQAAVFSSSGKQLSIKRTSVDAPPGSESESFVPDLSPQSASDLVFIK